MSLCSLTPKLRQPHEKSSEFFSPRILRYESMSQIQQSERHASKTYVSQDGPEGKNRSKSPVNSCEEPCKPSMQNNAHSDKRRGGGKANNYGFRVRLCFTCSSPDHVDAQCPRSSPADKRCNLCGEKGHFAKQCKAKANRGTRATKKTSLVEESKKDSEEKQRGTDDAFRALQEEVTLLKEDKDRVAGERDAAREQIRATEASVTVDSGPLHERPAVPETPPLPAEEIIKVNHALAFERSQEFAKTISVYVGPTFDTKGLFRGTSVSVGLMILILYWMSPFFVLEFVRGFFGDFSADAPLFAVNGILVHVFFASLCYFLGSAAWWAQHQMRKKGVYFFYDGPLETETFVDQRTADLSGTDIKYVSSLVYITEVEISRLALLAFQLMDVPRRFMKMTSKIIEESWNPCTHVREIISQSIRAATRPATQWTDPAKMRAFCHSVKSFGPSSLLMSLSDSYKRRPTNVELLSHLLSMRVLQVGTTDEMLVARCNRIMSTFASLNTDRYTPFRNEFPSLAAVKLARAYFASPEVRELITSSAF